MSRPSSTSETPVEKASFCAVDVETSGLRMTSRVIEVSPHSVEEVEPSGDIDELEALARSRLAIEMEYGGGSSRGPVVVTPQYLFSGNGHRYMKAYCHRDGIRKEYRFDRITGFRRL